MFMLYYNVSVVSGFSKAGGLLSVGDAGWGHLIAPHMFSFFRQQSILLWHYNLVGATYSTCDCSELLNT